MNNKDHSIMKKARELIDKHNLPMRLLRFAEQGEEGKPTFYFTSPERLDFRELVKDLNETFNTKIMLHQVSGREVAAEVGGIGPCGQETCCTRWLACPVNVSPAKLKKGRSGNKGGTVIGACGHIACCALYEQEGFKLKCWKKKAKTISKKEVSMTEPQPDKTTEKSKKEEPDKKEKPKKKLKQKIVRKLMVKKKAK